MTQNKSKKNRKKAAILISLILVGALVAFALLAKNTIGGLSPGWHDSRGVHSYYVLDDGEKATGYQEIDGVPCLFDKEGNMVRDKGWYDENGNLSDEGSEFYCEGDGKLSSGWKYVNGKVRYFYKKSDKRKGRRISSLAKDYTTAGKIHIPSKGYIDGDEGLALAYGMDVLNRYGWDLESAYKYSASLRFVPGTEDDYDMKVHSCALHGFKKGEGNCLAWAGTFCLMAKLLDKDCRLIWGTLQWRGTRPHAWTEIWDSDDATDEEIHVCDPRKNEGADMAGFYAHYGDKGTYRYDLASRQYLEW